MINCTITTYYHSINKYLPPESTCLYQSQCNSYTTFHKANHQIKLNNPKHQHSGYHNHNKLLILSSRRLPKQLPHCNRFTTSSINSILLEIATAPFSSPPCTYFANNSYLDKFKNETISHDITGISPSYIGDKILIFQQPQ